MAPRTRAKPNTHARMQRVPTQFSELEVTPSRPGDKQGIVSNGDDKSRLSQVNADDCSPSGHEERNFILDTDQQPIKSTNAFSWSDAGSTANTRRSSPANLCEVVTDGLWDFDEVESLAPFSSPTSEKGQLPDTMPLGRENQVDESLTPAHPVDFSETASTIRRSSPFELSEARKDIWDFDKSPSANGSPSDTLSGIPGSASYHLPPDELYERTPRKLVALVQSDVKHKDNEPVAISEMKGSSAKRPRRKAKEPIRFDPLTQQIVDVPAIKKKPTTTRLPIVRALQESAGTSSSPLASCQKRKPKKMKRSRAAKNPKPEKNATQSGLPPPVALSSSPEKVVVRSSSAGLQDSHNAGQHERVNSNLPASTSDASDGIQAPKQQHYPPPVAVDELESELNSEPKELHIEQDKSKRRKISRQFSVSERGSPVVIQDTAPVKQIDPILLELDSLVTSNPERHTGVPSLSFLRSESKDKKIEQQHDSAFYDVEGKSSSQWLRRISEKESTKKRKSSIGKRLHDEIMKSFLGDAEVTQQSQGEKLACATDTNLSSHVDRQMRRTVDQLIARLDGKKTVASNVADKYHKSGRDSLAHITQQSLQDRDNLAESFQNDGGLFGKKLQTARETVKIRSWARAKSAVDLEEVIKARRQAYGRKRSSLRAARDELARETEMGMP